MASSENLEAAIAVASASTIANITNSLEDASQEAVNNFLENATSDTLDQVLSGASEDVLNNIIDLADADALEAALEDASALAINNLVDLVPTGDLEELIENLGPDALSNLASSLTSEGLIRLTDALGAEALGEFVSNLSEQAVLDLLGTLPTDIAEDLLNSLPTDVLDGLTDIPGLENLGELGDLLGGLTGLLSGCAHVVIHPLCPTVGSLAAAIRQDHCEAEDMMLDHMANEFNAHRDWFTADFMIGHVIPAMQRFAEQMSLTAMNQTMNIGMFFDAKHQLETQRVFQELQVQAHKDYQPSQSFCSIGTAVRSMAHTEAAGRYTALALSRRQMARHLGQDNSGGAESVVDDKLQRFAQYRDYYCDPQDNNWLEGGGTGMTAVCGEDGGGETDRINIDIDYTRLIENRRVLDVYAGSWIGAEDEIDVMSLGNNLYGHDVFTRGISAQNIENEDMAHRYLKLRSIAAKRSISENSFNAIVGMKSLGSTIVTRGGDGEDGVETWRYLGRILQDLGIPEDEVVEYLGIGNLEEANADLSHFAQLEVLAKKIYQNPNFYAGLYDTPANVKRKSAALKAIELMLDRAIFESQLRQEMAMSVLLSTRLQGSVEKINRDIGRQ